MRSSLLFLALALFVGPAVAADLVSLRVIAVNDFHGNLEPVSGEGGAVALAATLARLQQGQAHTLFVSSGDLIGASPLPSALAHDEPTLALFRHLGLQANAIGNHELDGGLAESKRQEALAGFPFLSANLVETATGQPAFAPYRIVDVGGVRVAFIGATVRNALQPLEPASVPGLRLDDEAEALNAQAKLLRAQGVHALIALLHEGAGAQDSIVPAQGCAALSGPARAIAQKLDPDFDLVLSAHTHALYACRIGQRWLLQAGAKGRYLAVADLQLDANSGDVVGVAAHNEKVEPGDTVDPTVARLVGEAVAAAAKIANAPVAQLRTARLAVDELAREVASAQLSAGAGLGARMACTNPSSVPRELVASRPDNIASYGDVRAVQPYGNRLKLRRLSGAQLRALLEQQWRSAAAPVRLHCTRGLEYQLDDAHHVVPGSLQFMARPMTDSDSLLVVFNSYLARGGQGFSVLSGSQEVGDAGTDLDALLAWLRDQYPLPDPCRDATPKCTPRQLLAMPEATLRQFPDGVPFQCDNSQGYREDWYFKRCQKQALRFARKLAAKFPGTLEAPDPASFRYRANIAFYIDSFMLGREDSDSVGYLSVRVPLDWKP